MNTVRKNFKIELSNKQVIKIASKQNVMNLNFCIFLHYQLFFFHAIFQTIRIYPPLVAGRPQRKRSIYSEISNIIEISEYSLKI